MCITRGDPQPGNEASYIVHAGGCNQNLSLSLPTCIALFPVRVGMRLLPVPLAYQLCGCHLIAFQESVIQQLLLALTVRNAKIDTPQIYFFFPLYTRNHHIHGRQRQRKSGTAHHCSAPWKAVPGGALCLCIGARHAKCVRKILHVFLAMRKCSHSI